MIPPRKWKTPRGLRTPKPPVNSLETSFMSVEEEPESAFDDAAVDVPDNFVKVRLDGGSSEKKKRGAKLRDSPEERKRPNHSPTSAMFAGRKRMRFAQSTIKKKSASRPTASAFINPSQQESGRKLTFETAPERKDRSDAIIFEQQRRQRMERLELFERAAPSMSADAMKQVESELLWLKQQCPLSDSTFLERSARLLAALNDRLTQLQQADEQKTKGNELYKAQRYAEAEVAYSEAIRVDPNRAVNYSNRAAALIMLGRYMEAVEDCNQAIALDPIFIRSYVRSARASLSMGDAFTTYHKLNRVMRLKEQQGETGGETFREASDLAVQTKLYTDALEQGEAFLQKEDGELAEKKAIEALQIAPGSLRAKALNITAKLMIALKNDDAGEQLKRTISELEASVGRAGYTDIFRFGMMLWNRAYVTEATAFLGLVHAWAPVDAGEHKSYERVRDVDDFLRRAKKLRKEARYEDAVRFCDEAMGLCSQNDLLWSKICILRANIETLLGKFAEAEQDCQKALRRAPQYFAAHIVLASALAGQGKFIEAEKELLTVETGFSVLLKRNHREEIRSVRDDLKARMAAAAAKQQREQQQRFQHNQQQQSQRTGPSSKFPYKAQDENDMFAFLNPKHKLSYYMILGVDRGATKEEIRKAYKLKALKYHPDKNKDPRAQEAFKRIAEAHAVVSSPTKRRLYDVSLY